jgi:hypothetical protein
MSSYRICKTCGEYEHDCHCPKRASGLLKRVVSCELTIIRADLWAKVYAASVAAPANSAAQQMPREMADASVREFDERFKSKKAANDPSSATARQGALSGKETTE